MTEQEKLNELEPVTKVKIEALLLHARDRWPGRRIIVAETYRTQARRDKLFAKGPNTTMVKVSQHTRRKAADIYFINAKGILSCEEAPYKELAEIATSLGLTAGYYWKVPFDPGHFENR